MVYQLLTLSIGSESPTIINSYFIINMFNISSMELEIKAVTDTS